MSEIILVKAVRTCRGFPSQWDAWDIDGRYWYLRYRSHCGSMGRDYLGAQLAFDGDPGASSGEITLEEFCARIGMTYAPGLAGSVAVFEEAP